MRKWMRERLQRRKKSPAEPSDQPAPPPLQPAYFEAEQQSNDAPGEAASKARKPAPPVPPETESAPSPQPMATEESDGQPDPSGTRSSASDPAARRSRRRRGGRGRGGRGREQAVAEAFAPAGVKGSIPATVEEPAPEGISEAGDLEGEIAAAVAAPAAPKIPAQAPPAAQRAPKGVVVLAIGLPGSGKSSWFKRHNVTPLSSDMVRSLLFDDVREQRFQDLVFSNLRSMLKARLIAKRPTNYVDATNLTPQERAHWIKLARDYQYEVHAVFFDVPLDVCIERHERRDRVVPEDVMRRMAAKLKAPAFEEGFAKITVVRVKKKEDAAPGVR
ncbi:MAG: AAA family ATPase [Candidatus Sulfotelmatobacter sp.]